MYVWWTVALSTLSDMHRKESEGCRRSAAESPPWKFSASVAEHHVTYWKRFQALDSANVTFEQNGNDVDVLASSAGFCRKADSCMTVEKGMAECSAVPSRYRCSNLACDSGQSGFLVPDLFRQLVPLTLHSRQHVVVVRFSQRRLDFF
ncbi:hypothetical protein MTO96_004081 [Rhipicephalus appendiculatus]